MSIKLWFQATKEVLINEFKDKAPNIICKYGCKKVSDIIPIDKDQPIQFKLLDKFRMNNSKKHILDSKINIPEGWKLTKMCIQKHYANKAGLHNDLRILIKFQSLIGRLKTNEKRNDVYRHYKVSIPYR